MEESCLYVTALTVLPIGGEGGIRERIEKRFLKISQKLRVMFIRLAIFIMATYIYMYKVKEHEKNKQKIIRGNETENLNGFKR